MLKTSNNLVYARRKKVQWKHIPNLRHQSTNFNDLEENLTATVGDEKNAIAYRFS